MSEEYKILSDTDPSQEVLISDYKWTGKGFLSDFHMGIPEQFDIQVNCDIKNTGLVSFTFSTIPETDDKHFQKNIAVIIFDTIRDIYHDHVHHDRNDDATSSPIIADDDKEAISKIIEQYSSKIFRYHKTTRYYTKFILIKKFYNMRKRMMTLESAMGDFLYAQAFIDLHQSLIDNHDLVKKSFQRAYDSIGVLRQKSSWTLMYLISATLLAFALFTALFKVTTFAHSLIFPVILK